MVGWLNGFTVLWLTKIWIADHVVLQLHGMLLFFNDVDWSLAKPHVAINLSLRVSSVRYVDYIDLDRLQIIFWQQLTQLIQRKRHRRWKLSRQVQLKYENSFSELSWAELLNCTYSTFTRQAVVVRNNEDWSLTVPHNQLNHSQSTLSWLVRNLLCCA